MNLTEVKFYHHLPSHWKIDRAGNFSDVKIIDVSDSQFVIFTLYKKRVHFSRNKTLFRPEFRIHYRSNQKDSHGRLEVEVFFQENEFLIHGNAAAINELYSFWPEAKNFTML